MKNFYKFIILSLILLFGCFSFAPSSALALSLGPMQVKSAFGDPFHAEIKMTVKDTNDLEISIGEIQDYQLLEIDRPSVVDQLAVSIPAKIEGETFHLKVFSKRPFFYPSFNLLIKVTQGGGTIFENYLVTVDFRQSVSLKLKADKELSSPEEISSLQPGKQEKKMLVPSKESFGDGDENPKTQKRKVMAKEGGIHPTPLIVRELPEIKYPKSFPKKIIDDLETPVTSAQLLDKPIKTLRPKINRSKAEQVSQNSEVSKDRNKENANQKPKVNSKKAELESKTVSKNEQMLNETIISNQFYGPIKKGESLIAIARNLLTEPSNATKVAAALWMDNQEQFINNNIHGLKSGAKLSLKNLQNRVDNITFAKAKWIIKNHWQEWKLINERKRNPVDKVLTPIAHEMLLPEEKPEKKLAIHEVLDNWKSSWEKGDLSKHLSFFSKAPKNSRENVNKDFEYYSRFKKMMFRRHKNVQIRIHQPKIVILGNKAFVGFHQTFDSDLIKSFGWKSLELIEEGREWKIQKEKFSVKEFFDKTKLEEKKPDDSKFMPSMNAKFPYVIHASTKIDKLDSIQLVNQLRELGFAAYSAPLYVGPSRKIYRVFVGRFSGTEHSDKVSSVLRDTGLTPYAVALEMPYSLEIGEFLEEDNALEKAKMIQGKGYSSFMFSFKEPGKEEASVKIFLGAFLKKKNAIRMSKELTANSIDWNLVTP